MAKNDAVLLDGILDERISLQLPSDDRGEAFEYLAFEQILKEYDLSKDDIESGNVDGRDDGGIDGFFLFVNGHLLNDPESFLWPRTGSQLELWIITCKHHESFKQATIDNLVASISELFDLSLKPNELKGAYSERILNCRENLRLAYRKLSPNMNSFTVTFAYASRGDVNSLGSSVVARAEQTSAVVSEFFFDCKVSFDFYGSKELIALHRKTPNFSLDLPYLKILSSGERYVLLANLSDYYKFISDPDSGKLKRYLFDSNVRAFMGLNRVNEDIKNTLENDNSPDFWWLNNGVTILATSARVVGSEIQLNDIQIVNGLQTTESIFQHFRASRSANEERSVLIKIIVTSDEKIRDSIIRATNNQTSVESTALHATDKIQHDIEEILLRNGLYYERRTNFYAGSGHPPSEIISPLYLAAGYVSLVLKSPLKAANLRAKFMRNKDTYALVFSDRAPINVWPKIGHILKITDEALLASRSSSSIGKNRRFLKVWRHVASLLVLAKEFGGFDFSALDLANFDIELFTPEKVREVLEIADNLSDAQLPESHGYHKKSFYEQLIHQFADIYSIQNVSRLSLANAMRPRQHASSQAQPALEPASPELVIQLKQEMPAQPWKVGAHIPVIEKLGITNYQYRSAIQQLIEEGHFNIQRDGVVYDPEGNILGFDSERVDSATLELK